MKQQSTPIKYSPSNGSEWNPTMLCTAEDYRKVYPLGTWRHNPWTGTRRDDHDIGSDPKGLLILPPGEELVAVSDRAWIQVNCNPFSPVAGDVLVDVRTLGNDRESQRVPASDVQWSKVAAYRVSELGAPKRGVPVKIGATSAPDLLDAAAGHMRDRAATYDKPEGERSMGKTVQAFNTITGRDDQVITSVRSKLIGTLAVLKTEGQFVDHNVLIEMLQGIEVMLGSMPSRSLRESEGWLLMALLKMVRSETRETPHEDSVTDLIAYCALFGEARLVTK